MDLAPTSGLDASRSFQYGIIVAVAAATFLKGAPASGNPFQAAPGYVAGTGGFQSSQQIISRAGTSGPVAAVRGALHGPQWSEGSRTLRWKPSGSFETLGSLDNSVRSEIVGLTINASGTAFGYISEYDASFKDLGSYAVRWDAHSSTPSRLGMLYPVEIGNRPPTAMARASNDGGISVGDSTHYNANGEIAGTVAVLWNAAGVVSRLPGFDPQSSPLLRTIATGISEQGSVIGSATRYDDEYNQFDLAVRWSAASAAPMLLRALGVSQNGSFRSYATAVDSSGLAIGHCSKYDLAGEYMGQRAVRWDIGNENAIELGTINPNPTLWGESSQATDVNDAGSIVGSAAKFSTDQVSMGTRAVRWDSTGEAFELPTFGTSASGYARSGANAINSSGAVVGSVDRYADGSLAAFGDAVVWLPDGRPLALSSICAPGEGWIALMSATDISDSGWITGIGIFDSDGFGVGDGDYYRSFFMLVPEAGTYGRGDANFDTKIDFADLVILAQKYNASNPTQNTNVADFDLNGVTDFGDLVVLAQNYNSGVANVAGLGSDGFAADWALAQSLVPEPTAIATALVLTLVAIRRRK